MISPELAAAAAQAEAALLRGEADAYACMIIALARAAVEDQQGAQQFFDRALAIDPNDPSVLTGLASWHRQQGQLREAVLASDRAIRIAPDYADAWLERGLALSAGGSSRASRESYAQAARLAPGNAVAFAGLASQAARDGDMAEASVAARRSLEIDPGNLIAASALANALLHEGAVEDARALLAPLVAAAPSGHERSIATGILGRIFEKLGVYPAAYENYALAKRDFEKVHANLAAGRAGHTDFVEAIISGLHALPTEALSKVEADQPANAIAPHIFLLGYPRSGTTLVENVLASLPGVAALEEWPTLADSDERYLMGDAASIAQGLKDFGALDRGGRMELREAYWNRVRSAGVAPGATAFVDMDPLKGTRLPFIASLFPEARILLMRRDPRDVVWSCFKTGFAMTSGTLEYTTLERAARHYDAMMRLTELALQRLPLSVLEVDYRRLTREFDATTKEVCSFIGIDWTPEVRRFDKTAEKRGVGTASAAQVRQGLYDGSGQWEPFAQWMEPVMPILDPWVQRFGYAS